MLLIGRGLWTSRDIFFGRGMEVKDEVGGMRGRDLCLARVFGREGRREDREDKSVG